MTDLAGRLAKLSPEKRDLLLRRLQARDPAEARRRPAATGTARSTWPLTIEQERFWLADRLDPGNPAYNIGLAVRLRGPLDRRAFERAIALLEDRHDALRVVFTVEGGRPVQSPAASRSLPMAHLDLRERPSAMRQTDARSTANRLIRRRFDLLKGPLWASTLLSLDADDHVLVVAMHHIVSDGWSLGVLVQELSVMYEALRQGRAPAFMERPVSYREFVESQDLKGDRLGVESSLAFWRDHLRDAPEFVALPTDRPRPQTPTFNGTRRRLLFDEGDSAMIRALASATTATPFMILLAAFFALQRRFSAQSDLTIGIPTAGRDTPEAERVVGLLAGILVLRVQTSGAHSFRALVERVRAAALGAYSNADVGLARVIDACRPKRHSTSTPFIRSMFSNPPGVGSLRFADLEMTPFDVDPGTAIFDVSMLVYLDGARWSGYLEANTDLFDSSTVDDLAASYHALLRAGVELPDTPIEHLPLVGRVATRAAERATRRPLTIAMASTFPTDPLHAVLRFWTDELHLDVRIDVAPVNQVFQQLLDHDSVLANNRGGVNVVVVRLSDLGDAAGDASDPTEGLASNVHELVRTVRAASVEMPLIICVSESSASDAEEAHREPLAAAERLLRSELAAAPGVSVLASDDIEALYPWRRLEGDTARAPVLAFAQIPPAQTDDAFVALGTMIVRRVMATTRPPAKVVAVDCDNTLWGGICGEEADGVVLDAGRLAFQRRLVSMHASGILVCLCSRNNEADVFGVFDRHPGMLLRREHLAAWRIDWQPKSDMLRALADELNVGLASCVFLDDDPAVCAEVGARCPSVLTICLPHDSDCVAHTLDHVWPLDQVAITAEDRTRARFPAEQRLRDRARGEAPTLEAFLDGLGVDVACTPLGPDDVERAAQLTWRVNQLTVTTRRRPTAILAALLDRGMEGVAVRVRDRFGDYGFVGLMLFETAPDALVVDTFLLSCRALGRGVETRMLEWLARTASDRGVGHVEVPFVETSSNLPARRFLEAMEGEEVGSGQTGPRVFRFGLDCRRAGRDPDATRRRGDEPASPGPAAIDPSALEAGSIVEPWRLARIATDLATVDRIRAAMQARGARPGSRGETGRFEPPRTALEQTLADLWAQALNLPRVGRDENFFDLGGHSLLALRLLDPARNVAGADVPLSVFFENPTVAALAAAMEGGHPAASFTPPDHPDADVTLDPTIQTSGEVVRATLTAPAAVLLTGSTGFVGVHLLRALLDRTSADVLCLVRAENTNVARARIVHQLDRFNLTSEEIARVVPVTGDLALPRFGLTDEAFDRLADRVDGIFHVGAVVNFACPYSVLKASNVGGSQEILRLAGRGRPKAVHHVSTLGVLSGTEAPWNEGQAPERSTGIPTGYFQSKWVAERLAIAARARGIPVNLYRPGVVSGDSLSGQSSETDLLSAMMRLLVDLGAVPALDLSVDLTPVDYVAASIAAIASRPEALGGTFHICNPRPVSLGELAAAMTQAGFPVRQIPHAEWLVRVRQVAHAPETSGTSPFVPWIAGLLADETPGSTVLPFANGDARAIDCARTIEMLSGTGVTCPRVDAALVGRYLSRQFAAPRAGGGTVS